MRRITGHGKRSGRSRPQSAEATLPSHVRDRLFTYALAAGAAGAGTLMFTPSARAQIVYTPTQITFGVFDGGVPIDLNHDGIDDLKLRVFSSVHGVSSTFLTERLVAFKADGPGIGVIGRKEATALARGAMIGPEQRFQEHALSLAYDQLYYNFAGYWANVKDHFLGLQFSINSQVHYGWARLSVRTDVRGLISATLTGYAYNTAPGEPIRAGQTSASEASESVRATPGLGLLALGSQGLSAWRR